jgi:hypothetical protein
MQPEDSPRFLKVFQSLSGILFLRLEKILVGGFDGKADFVSWISIVMVIYILFFVTEGELQ